MTDLEYVVVGGYWMSSGECCNQSQQVFGSMARTLTTDVAVPFNDAGGGYFLGPSEAGIFYGRNPNNPQNGQLNDIWASCYSAIGNSNLLVSFIEAEFFNSDNPPFPDPNDQISRIYGEAKFLRAYNYWILAKTFAPPYAEENLSKMSVVYKTEPTTGFSNANATRASVDSLYQLIETDLKDAIENLPSEPRSADPDRYNYSRATKPAAKFLLARVSLEMQKWGQAQSNATEVIEDSRFNLNEDPIEAWNKNTFTRPNEVVWYYQWVDGDGVGQGSGWKWPKAWTSWNATRGNYGGGGGLDNTAKFIGASYSFLDKVGWMDPSDRSETTLAQEDMRYQQLFQRYDPGEDPAGFGLNRPVVWNNKYYRSGTPSLTNVPLLRLPEMYLTRAVASLTGENGANQNVSQARSDVNEVRMRAGLDPIQSGNLTEQMIHRERMRELAFEGDRLPYLQAMRMNIPNGDTHEGTGAFVQNVGRQANGDISWNSPDLVFSIPQGETDTNTEL